MTWLYILAVPVLLGLAFAAFSLGLTAICQRFAPSTVNSDWFPIVVTGAFIGLILLLLDVGEAWSGR